MLNLFLLLLLLLNISEPLAGHGDRDLTMPEKLLIAGSALAFVLAIILLSLIIRPIGQADGWCLY